jgi:hypothetical protein
MQPYASRTGTKKNLDALREAGAVAAGAGVPFHVARVNTARRIYLAIAAGATSIDGSAASRYSKVLPRLANACRAGDLFRPPGYDVQAVQQGIADWARAFDPWRRHGRDES